MTTVLIILAWTEEHHEVVEARRTDLGEAPRTRPVRVAKTVTWCLSGTEADLTKARQHAAKEGLTVHTFTAATLDEAHDEAARRALAAA